MTAWSQDALQQIAGTDDFHISPYRENGATPGTPTWIWSVAVDGNVYVYVRAYNGTASRWYQAALRQRAGRIRAGGGEWDVAFEPVDDDVADSALHEAVDAAYRAKYADSPYLAPMVSARTQAATVRVLPR
jgi:hypothetical protein